MRKLKVFFLLCVIFTQSCQWLNVDEQAALCQNVIGSLAPLNEDLDSNTFFLNYKEGTHEFKQIKIERYKEPQQDNHNILTQITIIVRLSDGTLAEDSFHLANGQWHHLKVCVTYNFKQLNTITYSAGLTVVRKYEWDGSDTIATAYDLKQLHRQLSEAYANLQQKGDLWKKQTKSVSAIWIAPGAPKDAMEEIPAKIRQQSVTIYPATESDLPESVIRFWRTNDIRNTYFIGFNKNITYLTELGDKNYD